MRNKVSFYINDELHEVGPDQASLMLSDYLRYEQGLTGTKVVCAEGDCGACSILKYFPHNQGTDTEHFLPVNSCIIPVASLDGSYILTIESLQDGANLHEAQRAMVENHASQCGYCTPGFVVSLAGLCEEKLAKKEMSISEVEIKNVSTGNLCRCTGYDAIIKAGKDIEVSKVKSLKSRYVKKERQEKLEQIFKESVLLESDEYEFYAPKTLKEAYDYLDINKEVRIVASGSDLGVVHNKRKLKLTHLLSLHLIEDFYKVSINEGRVEVGARVTVSELRHFIKDSIPEFGKYIDIFASPQIKNNATFIGNIANASPIGDIPPVMLALEANVTLVSAQGERVIKMSDFFLGYRQTEMKKNEIMTKVDFIIPAKDESFKLFKTSIRKDLDISIVNMALRCKLKDGKISQLKIAAGGISATTIRLKKTEAFLQGKQISSSTIENALEHANKEFTPLSDVRSSASYRRMVIGNFIKRFFSQVYEETKS